MSFNKSYNLRNPPKPATPRKKTSRKVSKKPRMATTSSESTLGPENTTQNLQNAIQTAGAPAADLGGNDHVTSEPAIRTAPNPPQERIVNEMMNKMERLFANLSSEMNTRFDLIGADILETKKSISDLKETVDFNSSRIQEVEKESLPKLKEEIKAKTKVLDDKLTLLEIHDRKQNLLVYGVENRGSNENIYDTVHDVFVYFLRIPKSEAMKIALVNAHRLPAPPVASNQPQIRPIIIRFVCMADRDKLLYAFDSSKRPKQAVVHSAPDASSASTSQHPTANSTQFARVTIRSDLPPAMKRERGRLASIAYKLRKEKHLATRIRINGTKVFLQTRPATDKSTVPGKWEMFEDK